MSFSDNIIRSKDGNWQIVIDEDAEGAHIRCTGNGGKKERIIKTKEVDNGRKIFGKEQGGYVRHPR